MIPLPRPWLLASAMLIGSAVGLLAGVAFTVVVHARIRPDVAIALAGDEAVVPDGHHMLAPALLRSQMLSLLYQAVHRGEMTKEDAERRLFYARGMLIRLHEDHSFRTPHGSSPTSSAGLTRLTRNTSL